MNKANIGKNLGILRRQYGITQEELAEAVDVTTDHIDHIENGNNGLSLPRLIHICRVLRVTPNDILSGEYEIEEEDSRTSHTLTLDRLRPEEQELLKHFHCFLSQKT